MMKKKTKSQYWSEYFEKYYGDVKKVMFDYQYRQTEVVLVNNYEAYAFCKKGDVWCFEKGFYIAYVKALRFTLKKIHATSYMSADVS